MKKLLIISPHFPPVSAPDMQRVRMSLPFYEQFGWKPVVLTVDEDYQEVLKEEDLNQTVAADIEIIKTKAFSSKVTRWLGIGNVGLRAWWQLWKKGCELLQSGSFDAVFFSTTQFFVLPLGPLWKKKYGTPFIVDIQDPWLTNYYYRKGVSKPPGGWKYHFSYLLALLLEGWVYRRASGFISVSARYFEELSQRYPWFGTKPQATIRFGASKEDQATALKISIPAARLPARHPDTLRFIYTGAAGPIMPKALNAFFDGVSHYRQAHPEKGSRLRFKFLGTSYAPPDKAVASVLPIAQEWNVQDLVVEIPCRLGFLECLRHQSEADVLLLLGSSDLAYSPSKLYTYYLSNRPILAPIFKHSVLEFMMKELNCARLVYVGEMASKEEARQGLADFFDDALAGFPPGTLPERNQKLFEKLYLAETLTEEQCRLFDLSLSS